MKKCNASGENNITQQYLLRQKEKNKLSYFWRKEYCTTVLAMMKKIMPFGMCQEEKVAFILLVFLCSLFYSNI